MGARRAIGIASATLALAAATSGSTATAAGPPVRPLNSPSSPTTAPFPSNRWTVTDDAQRTGLRVALPLPADCVARLDDCNDLSVLNTLDGFSSEPRVSIPFDGDIDPASVTRDTVFLERVGKPSRTVALDRLVWDPPTRTLHGWAQEQLEQGTRYEIVVTRDVRDSDGDRIGPARGRHGGGGVAISTVFTTQSVTAPMEKIAAQIHAAPEPAPADFRIAPSGGRAVFDLAAVQGITHTRQTTVAGGTQVVPIDLAAVRFVPGAAGLIAYGRFSSPTYLAGATARIPEVPTRTGVPVVQGTETVYLTLVLPSGSKPSEGWPVALVGHGATGEKDGPGGAFAFASILAAHGIATLAITQTGRGWGPLSTLTVRTTDGAATTFPAGGRGIDQNADGTIALREGDEATAPWRLILSRDSLRQHAADLLQLIRVIQVGVDVDGDGGMDLDPQKITYLGHSLGGTYAMPVVALEPAVQAAVLNVIGGPLTDGRRLQARFRPGLGQTFQTRQPPLLNSPGITSIDGVTIPCPCFNENLPLRGEPSVTNPAAGATALQQWFDRAGWSMQSSNPVAWAPYLPRQKVILGNARGDQSAPNPTSFNVISAGDLRSRTTLYRHDLFWNDHQTAIKDPHGHLTLLTNPVMSPIARAMQTQAATFLASGQIVDPDSVIGTSDYFETGMSEESLRSLQSLGWIP